MARSAPPLRGGGKCGGVHRGTRWRFYARRSVAIRCIAQQEGRPTRYRSAPSHHSGDGSLV
uniref:Uncharacterized protein n=1 Tax=uncultured marine virus TaxID=186617 RepID=A0A0F7L329_9VIRU|nr:hypothetical protein [uncultured marine virus]